MNCPGCGEKIHEEELIDGSCPLCGVEVGQDTDTIREIAELFESTETMAVNVDVERDTVERSFVLHASPTVLDRLKPKNCGACGRWHLRFGDKELHVSMSGDEGEMEHRYICRLCTAD